jgi:hypothetical protein
MSELSTTSNLELHGPVYGSRMSAGRRRQAIQIDLDAHSQNELSMTLDHGLRSANEIH